MRSRSTLLRRATASITAAGVALAGSLLLTSTPAQAAPKRFETPFSYQGSAFGTRVTLGDPNMGGLASGPTAWSILGCTKMAPIRNGAQSNVGKVNANEFVKIGAVQSFTSSYRKPKMRIFGSRSVNKVADITLGPADGPQLKIGAVTTTAHAFNNKGKFGSTAGFDLASVGLENIVPDGSGTPGPLQDLLDAVDQADDQLVEAIIGAAGTKGIDIPGLGSIYLAGKSRTPKGPNGAVSNAYGIRVELDNGSTVTIGRAWAKIEVGNPAGIFSGHAYGIGAKVLDGVLQLGRTPFQNLPCKGTDGEWREHSVLQLPQNENLDVKALTAGTYGKGFRDGRAVARARSSVADLSLGGGALEISGIVGQVNIFQNRKGQVVRRNINGTEVGSITANGEPQSLPAPGETLEIPGVAKIQAGYTRKLGKRGLLVHAVRIELLDGTGMVLNIGTAKARIGR
ncbi:choice-of-anchor P family protein [Nocardioides pakistanensis]